MTTFAIALGLFAVTASAQVTAPARPTGPPPRGEIRGRVVDSASQAPIANAIVEVRAVGGTMPATGSGARQDGGFRIQALAAGRYLVRVRALGFAARELPEVTVDAAAPGVDVGTVSLTALALELRAMEVRAARQELLLAPDRNTYVVRDMPTTRGGTALDVLRNVPAVDVDIDNVVSLRGTTGVKVQINGRPSPLKPAQLGNFLAQLPSAMVERVEVAPNPSAREDPEGVAGIINIVLKEQVDAGTSGGVTLGGGTTGHADVGANAGYERGPLSLFGSYGFARDDRPRTDAIHRTNLFTLPVTYLDETGLRTQEPLVHSMTGTVSYKPGRHDEISLDGVYSTRVEHESYGLVYRDLDAAHALADLRDRRTRNNNFESELETALSYRHSFASKGHRLSGELRFVRSEEGGPAIVTAHDLNLDGSLRALSAVERTDTWERPVERSFKADYARPLGGVLRLETGYKGALTRFHTLLDTRVLDTATAAFHPDSSRISDFTYDQFVNAGYAILAAVPGKFLLQGGVRVERATTQFDVRTTGASFDNDYDSVFPSALIAYNFDDERQVKLSYSTRIRRPNEPDMLDPTPHYADPLNLSVGNPYLKPEYIRALELGLQRSGDRVTVQLNTYFRHTIDAMRSVRSIDTLGVLTRRYVNLSTNDALGSDLTVALSGGKLTGFANAGIYRQVSNGQNAGPGLNTRTFGWSLRTNTAYHASPTFDLQALLSYEPAINVPQGRNASRTRVSAAARKKFLDDQLGVTLRVIDPFSNSRELSVASDPRFSQVTDRRRLIREVLLSFNWTFGKPREEDEPNLIGDPP